MDLTPPPSEANYEEAPATTEPIPSQENLSSLVPQNFSSPPFPILAELLDNLANDRRQEGRRKRLATWFNGWRRDAGMDLYPALRLILPQKDRERSVYGLKEKNLAKTYIKLIPLGMRDPDAVRLLNWKRPTDSDRTSGDFPTVLFEVVSKRSSVTQGSLTVDQVNNILDHISQNIGKQDIQSKLLQRIYNSCTPEEQRWIARIILKDMQINVKESTVLSVFHPDALDLYNACSDLKKVAHELWDPSHRLNEEDKQINLFHPFAPMLCRRPAGLEDSIRDMHGQNFIIEEKLDGERMQLHKRGKDFFYCSRKGKDYTYLYGANAESGSLTPYIHKAFDERVDEIILDGEMLVWDPVSERNLPFGTLKTAALDKSKSMANPRPCFKVFDLLYLNGVCVSRRSLKFRKRNLKSCMKEVKGRLEFVIEYEGNNLNDVRKRLDEIMASRGEGLILKHPNSEYVLNGRNKDWVKVKPEYMDNMGETVDVLVVSGNYGTGYRSGGVSTLVCAVLDDRRTTNEDDEPKYSTFVRIGTGLSYADYVWIRQKNWKPLDKNNLPSWYQASKKGSDDKGDVYLEPEDSFILKIKAAEITPSDQYHLGFTMRFPRAIFIRDDLGIEDCISATAVLENLKTGRKRKMEDSDSKTKKKRKVPKKPVTIMPEYQGEKLKNVDVHSDIFESLKFMVASDPRNRIGDKEKKEIQKLIHANGGTYVQIAKGIDPILVVYGGTVIPYDLKLIIDKDIHDIILPSWIYDCLEQGRRLPLHRKYFFHATSDRRLDKNYNARVEEEVAESRKEADKTNDSADEAPSSATQSDAEREAAEPPAQTSSQVDPAMADWFKVDKPLGKTSTNEPESDSETDPDSDYDELRFDEETEEWVLPEKVPEPGENGTPSTLQDTQDGRESAEVKMGEDDNAMELDPEKFFKHFRFYLDTPANAERYGMEVKTKYKEQTSSSFTDVEDLIVSYGGRVTSDLDDPKLTHVVLDKRDISRRRELMKRTSKSKRRYLVLGDFIHACVEEHSLLDEEGFVP